MPSVDVEVARRGRRGGLERAREERSGAEREAEGKDRFDPKAGVKFKICSPALDLWGNDLIPEVRETVGGAYVIGQAIDDDVVTLTY